MTHHSVPSAVDLAVDKAAQLPTSRSIPEVDSALTPLAAPLPTAPEPTPPGFGKLLDELHDATENYAMSMDRAAADPRGTAKLARMAATRSAIEAHVAFAEERASSGWECLEMVRERLTLFLGEEGMKGCAPMFYDDAIRSIAHKAAFGKLPREMYPEGSLLHRAETAEAANTELRSTLSQVEGEREAAVSRLFTAEREVERLREAELRAQHSLRHMKDEAGYHENVSFDDVWRETLAKAARVAALTVENEAQAAALTHLADEISGARQRSPLCIASHSARAYFAQLEGVARDPKSLIRLGSHDGGARHE